MDNNRVSGRISVICCGKIIISAHSSWGRVLLDRQQVELLIHDVEIVFH